MARLGALGGRLVFGIGTAVVTARVLGPAEKGTLSSLLFVGALLSYVSVLGLGDAATVLAGQRAVTLQHALRASVAPIGLASALTIVALIVVANIADWSGIASAITVAAVFVVVSAFAYLLTTFLDALERLRLTAMVSVASAAASLIATAALVWGAGLGIFGGVVGALAGPLVAVVLLRRALGEHELDLRPVLDRHYLRRALPMGVGMQATFILSSVADRADLLLVYALAGDVEAGTYAVALAIGQLATYTSSAVAAAIFPRLALADGDDVRALASLATRVSLVTATGSTIVLAAAMPALIAILFGPAYQGSVVPGMLLATSGIAFGAQLTLARAAAARGLTKLYFGSFAMSVSMLIVLDVLLVPEHGSRGAAVGSIISSAMGFAYIVITACRSGLVSMAQLRPRLSDIQLVTRLVRDSAVGRVGDRP